MKIAAITIALDNIKVDTKYNHHDFDGCKKTIKTLCFFGWKDRIIQNASKRLTDDINESLKEGKIYFRPYALNGKFYMKYIFICMDINYEFRKPYRVEKLEKIISNINE